MIEYTMERLWCEKSCILVDEDNESYYPTTLMDDMCKFYLEKAYEQSVIEAERSESAKKGWETRRRKEAEELANRFDALPTRLKQLMKRKGIVPPPKEE